MFKITNDLADAMLAAAKTSLDGGLLYIWAGPVPADASVALSGHTLLVTLTESADGSTGLTFEAPVDGVLAKETTETWRGVIATSGTPAYFRFCASGDAGTGAADTPRVQGTVGGPSSGADLVLGSSTLTANGTNTVTVSVFNLLQTLLT